MSSGQPFNELGQLLAAGAARSIAFGVNQGLTVAEAAARYAAVRGIVDGATIAGLAAETQQGIGNANLLNQIIGDALAAEGDPSLLPLSGEFNPVTGEIQVAAFVSPPGMGHPMTITADLPAGSTFGDFVEYVQDYIEGRMTSGLEDWQKYNIERLQAEDVEFLSVLQRLEGIGVISGIPIVD